jgi:hypothetical protein
MTMLPKCDRCGSDKDGMRLSGARVSYFCRECKREYAKSYSRRPASVINQKKSTKKWRALNPEVYREIRRQDGRKYRLMLRQRVLLAYGGEKPRCACCGESIPDFLAIDHIDGNGAKHRREIGGTGTAFYAWLVRNNYPKDFQILCNNCNIAKFRNGGVCPHVLLRVEVA